MNRVARLVVSFALPLLLLAYFICSLAYSIGCGLLGRSYAALSTYQTYAVTMLPFLLGGLVVGRLSGVWQWRRAWPPTRPETRAALSSVIILTASTLMYCSAESLIAILMAQAGCLLLVARLSAPNTVMLALTSLVAVVLSLLHKPPLVAVIPLLLGLAKTGGYWIKLRSVAAAKSGEGASQAGGAGAKLVSPDDFLAAEQVLVSILALAVASVMGHFAKPAPLSDPRLWLIAGASLGMGILGTRIMLRVEPIGLTFPAYRMLSLLAAFGASLSRGELQLKSSHWASWVACTLACLVVWFGTRGAMSSSRSTVVVSAPSPAT
jgi:hypothetical protein